MEINELSPPITHDTVICAHQPTYLQALTPIGSIYWYQYIDGSVVNIGEYLPFENPTISQTYYVQTERSVCKSEYVPITIEVKDCDNLSKPNVFTPNGDGKNDYFTPFFSDGSITDFNYSNCPRFVRSVQITIVDRTGKEVFNHDSNENIVDGIYINWDGRNKSGINLPSDTYYYLATVTFDILDETENVKEIKGWVQILR